MAAPSPFADALHAATLRGSEEVSRVMAVDEDAVCSTFHSSALFTAASRGHLEAVRVLLMDGRADPAASGSMALRAAAFWGRTDVVRLLLADGRADPTAEGGVVLCSAARWCAALDRGTEMFVALLADGRMEAAVEAAVATEMFCVFSKAAGCLQRHTRSVRRRRWVRAGGRGASVFKNHTTTYVANCFRTL
jgi:hypothetical protein